MKFRLEIDGKRVADFAENQRISFLIRCRRRLTARLARSATISGVHPDRPDAIPWEFKYYERSWGFCVRHNDIENLSDDTPVKGVIDVEFTDEDFRLGEIYLPGSSGRTFIPYEYLPPVPSERLLTGLVVGAELLRQLTQDKCARKYGIRLLVAGNNRDHCMV